VYRWSQLTLTRRATAVAGYDLTFSPVKSVSTLWAVAPRAVSQQIEAAHHAAIGDVIGWLEANAAYTRVGANGVRQVDIEGLVGAVFTHRDSRCGDPDLHTHVAISNKVQTRGTDGILRWLALDGRVIHKAAVAASERYNTRLEAHLVDRLGVAFTERAGTDLTKRTVREIVGVDEHLSGVWSARRASIDTRRAQLATAFQAAQGRAPSAVEALALAQQATLETRDAKHEPRSHAEQRLQWRTQAVDVLGGAHQLAAMLHAAVPAAHPRLLPGWMSSGLIRPPQRSSPRCPGRGRRGSPTTSGPRPNVPPAPPECDWTSWTPPWMRSSPPP